MQWPGCRAGGHCWVEHKVGSHSGEEGGPGTCLHRGQYTTIKHICVCVSTSYIKSAYLVSLTTDSPCMACRNYK